MQPWRSNSSNSGTVSVLQGSKTWRPPGDAELNELKEAVFASDAIVATDASASTDTASSDLAFIEPMEHTFRHMIHHELIDELEPMLAELSRQIAKYCISGTSPGQCTPLDIDSEDAWAVTQYSFHDSDC